MEAKFLSQVESAIDLVRKHRLRDLGLHPLARQIPDLLSARLGLGEESLETLADPFRGDVLREAIVDVIEAMKPSTPEDLNEPNWRYYIILKDYVVRGQRWSTVAERLGLARAAFFDWKKVAVEILAIELWHWQNEAAHRPEPVHHLPHPPYTDYILRVDDEERDYVERIIEELTMAPRAWFVAIDGSPGVGKTTLAYETARRCLERRLFDAIVWTSAQQQLLRPPDTIRIAEYVTSIETILDVIGTTLENREVLMAPTIERKWAVTQKLLAQNACLIIIDNMESLSQENKEQVYTFLQELPRPSKAIITGRERHYVGLYTVTLHGMELDGALMFMHEEARRRGLPPLTNEEVRQIHKKTQGNPLAMQQVVGLIQSLGYTLTEALAFEEVEHHDQMLDFMYAEAYDRLRADEQKILHALTLFAEPAATEAIEAASSVSGPQLAVGLARLYRIFLVQKANEMRYELLPFTREFLRSKQRRDGLLIEGVLLLDFLNSGHTNLTQYYVEYLDAMTLNEQLEFLKNEKKNIMGLMGWCYENQRWQLVIDLVSRMERPLATLRRLKELVEWGEKGMSACETVGNLEQREWFKVHSVAWPYIHMGEKERPHGRQMFKESLSIAQEKGYQRVEALALRNLGRMAMYDGECKKALKLFEESLALWEGVGDQVWVAHTVHAIGEVKFRLDRLSEAREDLIRAWKDLKIAQDVSGVVEVASDLALVLLAQGEREEALNLSDSSIRLSREIPKPARAYAYAQRRRAEMEARLGNVSEVEMRTEKAVQTYQDLGMDHWAKKSSELLESCRKGKEN